MSRACTVFKRCVSEIRENVLIEREGRQDKEFQVQNCFKSRLDDLGERYDAAGRSAYPDFRLVNHAEGYELKRLAYPGHATSYDSNSQLPSGEHNGRQVFYVFGSYPVDSDGNTYPVLDLVFCHGSFPNADNEYEHKNRSFVGLRSYGEILVRDRKMYVAWPTFALAEGTVHHRTLILLERLPTDGDLNEIAILTRKEAQQQVVAYILDLITNILEISLAPNSSAGEEHVFKAYRMESDTLTPVDLVDHLREKAKRRRLDSICKDINEGHDYE